MASYRQILERLINQDQKQQSQDMLQSAIARDNDLYYQLEQAAQKVNQSVKQAIDLDDYNLGSLIGNKANMNGNQLGYVPPTGTNIFNGLSTNYIETIEEKEDAQLAANRRQAGAGINQAAAGENQANAVAQQSQQAGSTPDATLEDAKEVAGFVGNALNKIPKLTPFPNKR